MPADPQSLVTRASLLGRLSDWEDHASWAEFHRLYHKLVFGLARRTGLSEEEAEEVAQDVFKRVAETIHVFESDPARGSFKGWLMNLTRWRVSDKFRQRPPVPLESLAAADSSTGPLGRIPDEAALLTDWEGDWRRHVLDLALQAVARKTEAKHFQVFDLHHRQGWPILRIARELGMNPATLYVINHRLKNLLCAEAERLKQRLG